MTAPDAAMLEPVNKIARFIAGGGDENLSAFASEGVAILENFAPYLFTGPGAVTGWARAMRAHAEHLRDMVHSFGPAQDFASDGARAYFSLPTHWTGISRSVRFAEDGGWAFVLVREAGGWRVRHYGWAVTGITVLPQAAF